VESLQDLAMKEIPDLLIRTRFDPALLFSWVDRALLWNQAGDNTPLLERANIRSASQLLLRAGQGSIDEVLESLRDAQARAPTDSLADSATVSPAGPPPLSRAMLANIISGLENGPNLYYVSNYLRQVSHPDAAKP